MQHQTSSPKIKDVKFNKETDANAEDWGNQKIRSEKSEDKNKNDKTHSLPY
jgi:hypothetical protein